METEAAANPGGTIAALFALAAFVVGLFSGRFRMAVIWSAVIGGACLALFFAILLAYAPDNSYPPRARGVCSAMGFSPSCWVCWALESARLSRCCSSCRGSPPVGLRRHDPHRPVRFMHGNPRLEPTERSFPCLTPS
jgi:hypothetical protein